MKKLNFILLFMLPFLLCAQQNPKKYFENVNKAELAICDSSYFDAANYYKEAVKHLEEPFGGDLYNLAICGFLNNDSTALQICADKYVERGYKFNERFLENFPENMTSYWTQLTETTHKKLTLDTAFIKLIRELHIIDQKRLNGGKSSQNEEIVSRIMRRLQRYMNENNKFISEKYVGNDGDNACLSLKGETLLINCASFYGMEKESAKGAANLKLKEKVIAGEFNPRLYAHMYDGRGYAFDGKLADRKKGYATNYIGYTYSKSEGLKMFEPSFSEKELEELNKRRTEIYLEPFEDFLKKHKYYYKMCTEDPSVSYFSAPSGFFFNIVYSWDRMVGIDMD